jgi:hypothetical protein
MLRNNVELDLKTKLIEGEMSKPKSPISWV